MKNNLPTKWILLLSGVIACCLFSTGLQAQSFPTPTGFTLPNGKTIVITYDVDVNANACTPGTLAPANLSNQSNVSGTNFATVQTDDPDIAGSPGPTLTPFSSLSLGNLVYKDVNSNGVFDAGDAGVNGVLLRIYVDNGDGVLTAADGAALTTATTAGGGLYTFTGLCPGDYIVEVAASNFNPGGPLYDNGLSAALISSPVGGAADPDNDVNNDDNGDPVAGFGVASQAITLSYGGEPINDGDTDNNTNLSLDFGFKNPTTVSISDVTQSEGTGGGTTAFSFTVTRSIPDEAFSLTVNTSDGTATSPSDYTAITGGTVSFTAGGPLTQTVTVLVNQDAMVEGNETFTVLLSGAPAGIIVTDGSGLGTITNDDNATVTLSGGIAQNEGNSGTTTYTFTATLSNAVQGGFTVPYTTNNGTATTADNDYVDNDGTLTFAGTAGEIQTFTVLVNGDTKVEADETFTTALGAIGGTSLGASITTAGTPQTGTITNDDNATVTLSGGIAQNEGNSGTTTYTFTATLNNAVQGGFVVTYGANDGTATLADGDFQVSGGALTFAGTAGETKTFTVLVNGDTKVETNETFTASLGTITGTPLGASISTAGSPQTATITNDDSATLTLSGGIAQNEGNSGTTAYPFTLTLSAAVQGGFTANYLTNDGTATTADNDYVDNDGALIFTGTAGETKMFTVLVNGDLNIEANETFQTVISNLVGGSNVASILAAGSPQTATITNDEQDWGDAPTAAQSGFVYNYPTLLAQNGARHAATLGGLRLGATIDAETDGQPNATATGDDGDEDGVILPPSLIAGTTATITVNASGPGKLDGWVDFNRNGRWADTLLSVEQVFTSVNLVAGANTLTFAVPAAGGTGSQLGTSFARFRISTAGGLTVRGLAADGEVEDYQVSILNNQFSIDNPSVAEGNSGTSNLVFTVTRSTNATASSVDYAITGGTATSGSDYAPLAAGTLSFAAGGALTQQITVVVNGDLVVENNETVIITLSNPVNGGIGTSPGTGTITNDDAASLTLSGGVAKNEGNSGTVAYTFTATLNPTVQGGFTVPYTTNDGTATTADGDYLDNDGTLTFAGTAGETQMFTVLVNGDTKVELDETFTVALGALVGAPAGVTVGGSPQTATITNDDAATVSIAADVSQAEAITPQTFSVTLSNAVDVPVTVLFSTANGTATTADNDYTGITNQTVTFAAGTTTAQSVPVSIGNDSKVEANETYTVNLSSLNAGGRNVAIGTGTRTGTIVNDDNATVTLSGGIAQNEGNSSTTSYTFTATLNNPVQGGFTVPYTTNDGTATTADADYMDNDGTLTFAGTGGEIQTFTVLVNGDTKVELNETFTTALGAISGAPAGVTTAGSPQTGTITNDDAATVSIAADVSQAEALTPQTFSVTLSNAVDVPVTVQFSTADGTATTADNDYNGITNQTVTFAAGTTTAQSVLVAIVNDLKVEANETYTATIAGLSASGRNVSLGTATRTGTIVNDDNATVTLTGGIAKNEGNVGSTTYVFTATLSADVQGGFTLPYTTNDGTATLADNDYIDNDNTLTFTGTAGEVKNVQVAITGDIKVELDETFTFALGAIAGAPAGVTVVGSPQTGTITNDDAAAISIVADINQLESVTPQTFTISLTNPVDVPVTVQFSTANGTATTADNDYTAVTNQTVTFAAGTTTAQSVAVPVNNDTKVEANETYTVSLSGLLASGRNVTINVGTRTGTILNDDNSVVALSGGVSQNEGNSGNTAFTFTVTLTNAVQGGFTANYTTSDGTATTADNDYTDNDNALIFAGTAGETKTFTVNVIGDHKVEANETFLTAINSLSGVVNPGAVTIAGSPQTATIINDEVDFGDAPDSYSTLLASNGARHNTLLGFQLGAAIDGEDDGQPSANATGDGADEDGVTLPNPLVTNTTANLVVNASQAGKIDAWVDFNNNGSFGDAGEKVFNNVSVIAGNNSLSFAVPNGATPSNTFARFRLSSAGGLSFDGSASDGEVEDYAVQIVNTQFSINDPSVAEGNSGTSNLNFTVTRSNNASACSVNYAITGGTATTADNDYQPLAAGTVSFTAGGALTATITVLVNGDTKVELNETVDITLSNPVNGSILDGSGTGTITNDDAATITVTNTSVTEGDTPNTTTMTFTINMSNPSDANVAVNYATVDGTATIANNDYQAASGTLTFTPGQVSKTVVVTVVGDCAIESNETMILRLSGLVNNGRNVSLSGGGATLDGTGTINNDDALPVITCPANLTVNNTPNVCNATVTLPLPTLSSICGGSTLEFHYRTVNAANTPTGAYNAFAPAASNTVVFPVGRYEVEWRITDGSGSASCSFILVVVDSQLPTAICQNIMVNLDINGMVTITPAQVNNGSFDNCGISNISLSQTTFTCANIGTNIVFLNVVDVSNNKGVCTAIVTVKDVIAPVALCKNVTVNLGSNGSVIVTPAQVNNGSSDICGLTLSLTPNTFSCANVGNNNVTLKATDPGGNMSTCTAIVTVKDLTPPTALCKNINVFLDNTGHASITPASVNNGSTDNCGIATLTINNSQFDCGQIGGSPVAVLLTLKDQFNNQSTCIAYVTVKDAIAPTPICQDVTVQLDNKGRATVYPSALAGGSYDNCSVWSYSPTAKLYTCANIGENSLTITVKDYSNNAATCTSGVTVVPGPTGCFTNQNPNSFNTPDQTGLMTDEALGLRIFPNPTVEQVMVQFELPTDQPYTLRLFDLTGRLLLFEENSGFAGENQRLLPLGDQPSGLYLLEVQTDSRKAQQRLVIQRD